MTQHTLAASAFTSDQYADAYPPGSERGYWALTRNRLLCDLLIEARKDGLWSGVETVLEVGCGTGIVVRAMRERGYDTWGVELAEPPVLADVAPYVVLGRDAVDLDPAFRDRVTAVLLLDVIEHIDEPAPFLAKLVASFPRCEIFVLTVPARQEVWSNYDVYYGHHRRYDRVSLARTLREAGLDPTISRYFFFPLYLAALLLALTRRRRSVLVTSPRHLGLHRTLAGALYAIERVLRPFPALPGLSLLAVAVRPAVWPDRA
jgi:SAM-dependent methyltransferase